MPDLDARLPKGYKILEVRLLSVEKEFRNGLVFSKLVGLLAQHFKDLGYDLAIISGNNNNYACAAALAAAHVIPGGDTTSIRS